MEKDSRQVRRQEKRLAQKTGKATHREYWIERERKSRVGIVYKYFKKVVDIIGLTKK